MSYTPFRKLFEDLEIEYEDFDMIDDDSMTLYNVTYQGDKFPYANVNLREGLVKLSGRKDDIETLKNFKIKTRRI
jgi:hypothetical protein